LFGKYHFRTYFISIALGLVTVVALAQAISTLRQSIALTQLQKSVATYSDTLNRLVHLDEAITLSLQLAAQTQNDKWQKNYQDIRARALKNIEFLAVHSSESDFSNLRTQLNATENEAIHLLEQGQYQQALALLGGAEYRRQKTIFAEKIQVHLLRAGEWGQSNIQRLRGEVRLSAALTIVMYTLAFFCWAFALRVVRDWVLRQAKSRRREDMPQTKYA
jgi:hypothetical protein